MTTADPALIRRVSSTWQPETRQAMVEYLRNSRAREALKTRYRNAAELAKAVDPGYNITPALRMVADAIETVLSRPRHNLLVTTPPQEGKSSLCAVYTPLRALQLNPNRRIILATYGDSLAEDHSRACRDIITRHGAGVVDAMTGVTVEDKLGLELSPTSSKVHSWRIAGARGGMIAVGLGSSITGRAADLFIIDDPYKNMQEADSATHRRRVDEWFASVAQTRLSPEASMVLIQCMTGDTPVLRPNGTETPLRDIRVGDRIATYENGQLTTSTVRNWANQGPDDVLSIKLKSGRTVRANARHPFLTIKGGREVWTRVQDLRVGDTIRSVQRTGAPTKSGGGVSATGTAIPPANPQDESTLLAGGGSGSEQSALSMAATTQPSAKDCATAITGRPAGLPDTDLRRSPPETVISNTDTGSTTTSTTDSSLSRMDAARSVSGPHQQVTDRSTGKAISASIIATRRVSSEGFSAMTAISPSPGWEPPTRRGEPLSTWSVGTDEIVSISADGYEDVFDIEVERTENFIANGAAVHNTRWHPEDLAGQIIAGEQQVEPRYRTWRHINVPAISEVGIYDSLGRNDDEVMVSARGRTRDEFEQTRRKVGERVWYALYQGSPRNPAGGLFMRAWFDNTRLPVAPDKTVATVIGIDPADSGEGDETGIVAATLAEDGTVILTEDWSGQMTADEWARRAVMLALNTGAREIAMEAYASATTYVSVIKRAWKDIHDEVVAKRTRGNYLSPIEERALSANMPFTIFKWRGRNGADAVGRSSLLRQAFETGKCKTVENKLAVFEAQAADWQAGQHQPDRVAAALIAHDRIAALSGGRVLMSVPVDGPPTAAPAWLKRRIG